MGNKHKKKTGGLKEFGARKAERYSRHGRELEKRVALILEKMRKEGRINGFICHRPYSREDLDGYDFTVIRMQNERESKISFGVTISARSLRKYEFNHPGKPCIHIPFEMRDERISERIERLF